MVLSQPGAFIRLSGFQKNKQKTSRLNTVTGCSEHTAVWASRNRWSYMHVLGGFQQKNVHPQLCVEEGTLLIPTPVSRISVDAQAL